MGLISQSIPSLIGGVSQQAPSQRLLTQVESQKNCLNSVAQGVRKRPNTELLAVLDNGAVDLTQAHIHQINRDEYEKYIIGVTPQGMYAYDRQTGHNYTVKHLANPEGIDPVHYLGLDNHVGASRKAYQTLTSADTTYILNTSKAVHRKTGDINVDDVTQREAITISAMRPAEPTKLEGFYVYRVDGVPAVSITQAADPRTVAKKLHTFLRTRAAYNAFTFHLRDNVIYVDQPKGAAKIDVTEESYSNIFFEPELAKWIESPEVTLSRRDTSVVLDVAGASSPEALVHIRQADYNVTYSITINGQRASITTPEATSERARAGLSLTLLMVQLSSAVNALSTSVTATVLNGYILLSGAEDFTISASDDLNNMAIVAIQNSTQIFSDLPDKAPNGFLVKIIGSLEDEGNGYWVQFKQTGDVGAGHWEEGRILTESHRLDPSTMPHTLIRTSHVDYVTEDNPLGVYFEFGEAPWDERTVGDDEATPFPSFVSGWDNEANLPKESEKRYIHTLSFHKNRLVFTSDENIILSESGNFWNFFRTTAQVVKDSDRIDIAVLSKSVNPIRAVLAAQKELLLYGERQQFALRSGDIFSANTVYADPLMSYDVDLTAPPQAVGNSVYFTVNRKKFNGIFESTVSDEKHTAHEVTAHCPEYIKGRVRKLAVTGSEDIVLTVVEDAGANSVSHLYAYSFKTSGNEKVQSAWNEWEFYGNVVDVSILKSTATFLIERDGVYTIEAMHLAEDNVKDVIGVPVFLDARQEVQLDAVAPEGQRIVKYKGKAYQGYPYTQELELTQLFLKDRDNRSIQTGRLQLRNITFAYDETTAFDVVIKQEAREERVVSFEGRRIGSVLNRIGEIPIDSGELRVPLQGRSKGMSVKVINSEPFDCRLQSAEWEAVYHSRARRS